MKVQLLDFFLIKDVKEHFKKYWVVWVASLLWGLFVQLIWIDGRCGDQSFFHAKDRVCQDNVLRILVGPFLLIPLFWLILITEIALVLHYVKPEEHMISKLLEKVKLLFLPLFLVILLPIFGYASVYVYILLAITFVIHLLILLNPKLKPNYTKIEYTLIENDTKLVINFYGYFTKEHRFMLFSDLSSLILYLSHSLEVTIDEIILDTSKLKSKDSYGDLLIGLVNDSLKLYNFTVTNVSTSTSTKTSDVKKKVASSKTEVKKDSSKTKTSKTTK